MVEKCSSCGSEMSTVFLEKIAGTYLRDKKGKKRPVCSACQHAFSVESLRQKLT